MIIDKLLLAEICPSGSLKKEQLLILGMPNPPSKNWKREVIGKNLSEPMIEKLIYLGNLSKSSLNKIKAKARKKEKKLDALLNLSVFDVNSHSFLQSYEWRKLRLQALMLHGSKCQCCGASTSTGSVMNVDHIKPRKLFPKLALDINNLQVLCDSCNHGKGNWTCADFRK